MHFTQHQICWLRERFSWMGKHSGYDLICDYINTICDQNNKSIFRTTLPLPRIIRIIQNTLFNELNISKTYDHNSLIAETKALLNLIGNSYNIVHILYVERSLALLSLLPRKKRDKLIGTVHQPAELWKNGRHKTNVLSSLDALIVLSRQEMKFFNEFLPGRVHFIPHGIDINFFKPIDESQFKIKRNKAPRCVFSGVWLRDTKTLLNVIDKVLRIDPNFNFDILVPENRRNNNHFDKMSIYNQVCWHSNLTDYQLRSLYQNASMLLLPMHNCTANNALLEAIACGIPVVTNDVGGIKDYTNNTFADILPVGDVDGMVDAVLSLGENPEKYRRRGLQARSFAENHLSWQLSAAKTIDLYHTVHTDKDRI